MERGIIIKGKDVIINAPHNEIWMTQHELADLFQCFVAKVNANVRSILKSGVLDETKVCRTYYYKNGNSVEQYGLEMIIALSFRIRSCNADTFREWTVKKATVKQIFICSNWNQNAMLN
jgi:hypothetical protein